MKRKTVRQQKTIIALTPEEWDEKVNAALASMLDDSGHDPTIERTRTEDGGFQAVIEFWKEFSEPEDIRDEYNLRGEVYRCEDCPNLRRERDRRIRWLTCDKGMKETTKESAEACLWYYEQIDKARRGNND